MELVGLRELSAGLRRVLMVLALAVAFGMVATTCALAQVQMTPAACKDLGDWVERMAQIRDLGADRDRHIAWMKARNGGLARQFVQIMEGELQRIYNDRPRLAPDQASTSTYTRCMVGAIGAVDS